MPCSMAISAWDTSSLNCGSSANKQKNITRNKIRNAFWKAASYWRDLSQRWVFFCRNVDCFSVFYHKWCWENWKSYIFHTFHFLHSSCCYFQCLWATIVSQFTSTYLEKSIAAQSMSMARRWTKLTLWRLKKFYQLERYCKLLMLFTQNSSNSALELWLNRTWHQKWNGWQSHLLIYSL